MLQTLRDLLDASPFVPFRIVLTSGDRYEVTDPHLVAIGRTQVFYCFPRSDRVAHLRMNQVAALESASETSES